MTRLIWITFTLLVAGCNARGLDGNSDGGAPQQGIYDVTVQPVSTTCSSPAGTSSFYPQLAIFNWPHALTVQVPYMQATMAPFQLASGSAENSWVQCGEVYDLALRVQSMDGNELRLLRTETWSDAAALQPNCAPTMPADCSASATLTYALAEPCAEPCTVVSIMAGQFACWCPGDAGAPGR
jgi:hypothetical protein